MIRLRPYKASDAGYLLNWVDGERCFAMWCAGKFTYPLTAEQLEKYRKTYEQDEHSWIFSALDENGTPVGHFFLRGADYQKQSVHLGFIVVDPRRRGQGCGKEMVTLAVKYAFEILKMNRVTLKVFENNPAAHACYLASGFREEAYRSGDFPYKDETWGRYDMVIERIAESPGGRN
ncbi:MAG: GNAT family N-acetyltransferase [Clostridiales bacterium]|nr:GNAT family N-acetyltransferase [Clostridiales bacterium]